MLTSHTTKRGTPVSLVTRDKGVEDRLLGSIPAEIEDRWCMLSRNIRLRGSSTNTVVSGPVTVRW